MLGVWVLTFERCVYSTGVFTGKSCRESRQTLVKLWHQPPSLALLDNPQIFPSQVTMIKDRTLISAGERLFKTKPSARSSFHTLSFIVLASGPDRSFVFLTPTPPPSLFVHSRLKSPVSKRSVKTPLVRNWRIPKGTGCVYHVSENRQYSPSRLRAQFT